MYLCQISRTNHVFTYTSTSLSKKGVLRWAISYIFQQSDVRRCVKIVQCLSLFVWKCNLYCLQIKERNSLFQAFSLWDCVYRKKENSKWVGSFPLPFFLFIFCRHLTLLHTPLESFRFEEENEYEYENLNFMRMFQKEDCTPENFILLFSVKRLFILKEVKPPPDRKLTELLTFDNLFPPLWHSRLNSL